MGYILVAFVSAGCTLITRRVPIGVMTYLLSPAEDEKAGQRLQKTLTPR